MRILDLFAVNDREIVIYRLNSNGSKQLDDLRSLRLMPECTQVEIVRERIRSA